MFCPVMWLCSDTDERDRNSECGEVVSSPCMICVSNIPPAFLPHFPSDILLLTIFVTGWLPPPCLMWRRKRTWWSASKKLLSIGLLAKRSLQMLIPSHHTNDDWIFFSKILCINILFRGLNWASIMKRRRRWKEYRNRPGEPMSNHYFSV